MMAAPVGRAGRTIGVDLVHDHALGARDDVAPGIVGEEPEAAHLGVETVTDQAGEFRRPFLGAAAVVELYVARDDQALLVERQAGAEVDCARESALDHVGGLVLVGIDAGKQLGRHVVELETSGGIGREAVASVEVGFDEGQAADQDLGRFSRRMGAVVRRLQAIDGNAWDTLERASRRLIRERADVRRGDGIDDGPSVLLDRLGSFEGSPHADDHDLILLGRIRLGGRCLRRLRLLTGRRILRRNSRALCGCRSRSGQRDD